MLARAPGALARSADIDSPSSGAIDGTTAVTSSSCGPMRIDAAYLIAGPVSTRMQSFDGFDDEPQHDRQAEADRQDAERDHKPIAHAAPVGRLGHPNQLALRALPQAPGG